jgi:hypothetical protein
MQKYNIFHIYLPFVFQEKKITATLWHSVYDDDE